MTKKVRVLHVIDSFDLGGAQEALVNLVAFADRAQFELEVAAMHGPGVYSRTFEKLGVPVHSLSPHKLLPLYLPRLWQLIRRGSFDVVHCHLIASNLIAKPMAALLGVPVRFNHDQTHDEYRYRNHLRLFLDRFTNRFSSHVCAVSKSIRDFLIEYERLSPERVSVVYNAIDLDRFAPEPGHRAAARARWKIPADGTVVAGVGRLNYQKNFALFLEVAERIIRRHPHTFFVLAGTGPEEGALREQAGRLGLDGSRLLFGGYIEEMETFYPAIDCLLMPSRFEGLPMTLLEAMAMGLPVVASKLDGIAELIVDGVDGYLVSPGDLEAFVTRLGEVLANPEAARAIALAGQAKVRAQFSAATMARQVETLYLRHCAQLA